MKPGCQTPMVLSRMSPVVAQVAAAAAGWAALEAGVKPGCQTPLALSLMSPSVAQVVALPGAPS